MIFQHSCDHKVCTDEDMPPSAIAHRPIQCGHRSRLFYLRHMAFLACLLAIEIRILPDPLSRSDGKQKMLRHSGQAAGIASFCSSRPRREIERGRPCRGLHRGPQGESRPCDRTNTHSQSVACAPDDRWPRAESWQYGSREEFAIMLARQSNPME